MYIPIYLTIIFGISFILSTCLTGMLFNFLQTSLFNTMAIISFVIPIFALIISYCMFILSSIIFYRAILKRIPEKEAIFLIRGNPRDYVKQELRIILDAVIVGLAKPILFILPQFLRLLKCKSGKNLVLTGTVYNADIVEIGDNVIIGAGSIVTGHLGEGNKRIFKKIRIGNNCTIGINSVVMPGVTIGDNSLIAAGAVVPTNAMIPRNEIWGGIPARKIGKIEGGQIKNV